MITKKKAVPLIKFGRTTHQKNGIIPLLSASWKYSEKMVQWMEDMAQGGLELSSEENMGLMEELVCLQEERSNLSSNL